MSRAAVATSLAVACLFLGATAAHAVGSVTMTVSPSATISGWSLSSAGANSTSGGTMTLDATTAYTVTVSADKASMSEWDGAYVTGGKTLGTALTVTPTRTGGTATVPGVGSVVAVSTSDGTLVTGTGIGTDTFSISLSQPTAITDSAVVSGHTYHIVLTYTAQTVL